MRPGTRYPHAPITEAVIDIQCEARVSLEELANVNSGEAGYQKPEKIFAASSMLQFGPEANAIAAARAEPIGFVCRSQDGLHIYQARLNGFTFSRLAEYTSWDEVSAEARRLWDKYQKIAAAANITRIALRYINRLDLPLPVRDFSFYLKTVPQLSADLPQGVYRYFMQLQLPLPNVQGTCLINQTIIDPPVKPNTVPIVLDIDVFRPWDAETKGADLWEELGRLRHEKNQVFEACITDEARRLFQ